MNGDSTVFAGGNDLGGMLPGGMNGGRYLTIIDTSGRIEEISLDQIGKQRIYFGHDASKCDIVINSGIISRVHGKFKLEGNRMLYADLYSTNGTILEMDGHRRFLRGNEQYCEMRSGSILRIQPPESNAGNSVMLLYTDSSEKGVWRKFPLLTAKVRIGRDQDNDIVLQHPGVSRFHAEIIKTPQGMLLSDSKSSNGTWLNGMRLKNGTLLHEKDVIRIIDSTLIYTNGLIFYKNSMQGINIEISGMNKIVGGNKKILDNVSCNIESNEFVAIIGGSGAGKSTLMNAISGFDRKVQGTVKFNGIDLHSHFQELKNLIGYVPQEDIIYENLTLRRMLHYTAKLKLPGDLSAAEIQNRINKVLSMVELSAHQNTFIRKLSGGQKKRASIAVELLADPSVFFLDEPTSGLDPGTEQKLMVTLNKLSKAQGKTIIMVTHTTQSLSLCDKVIFMGQGGRLCFCGTTEQAKMFFDTDDLVNIYNMISEDSQFWSDQYRNCMADTFVPPSSGMNKIEKRKKPFPLKQLPVLILRYMELIKNDLPRLAMLFAQPVLIALLLAIVANDKVFDIYEDTKSILFSLSCAGIWIGLFNSIQEICKERVILKREYMGNLKLPMYIISKFLVQTLLGAIQALLMTLIFALTVGLPEAGILFDAPFFEIYFTVWMTVEASMALGFVISSLVRTGDKAMTLAPFVLIVQLLFSGILFELKGAGDYISYVTISKWSMEGLGSISNLNDMTLKIQEQIPTAEHEFDAAFEAVSGHLFSVWGILAGIMLLCAVFCTVMLRSLSRDSR